MMTFFGLILKHFYLYYSHSFLDYFLHTQRVVITLSHHDHYDLILMYN